MLTEKDETLCQRRSQSAQIVLFHKLLPFDCLPHKLLINKLDAYGVSESALKLIKNISLTENSVSKSAI
jgi:hypothetical protein